MTIVDLATPKLAELDAARATVERLAAANQALTQRLDREHSMRLAAEERAAALTSGSGFKAWNIPDLSEPIEPAPTEVCDECGAETDDEGCAINPSSAALASWECRAHEAEAALEALRADVERDRSELASFAEVLWSFDGGEAARLWDAVPSPADAIAVHSVCELLAAWGRFVDRNNAQVSVAEARTAARIAALWDANCVASDAIRLLARGTR